MLSQLYRYGEFAFVGGGFKEGLHNILEAACYGIPIFFGNSAPYDKYQEAIDLVNQNGAFAITDTNELASQFQKLADDPARYHEACDTTRNYVQSQAGATGKITTHLLKLLESWKAA